MTFNEHDIDKSNESIMMTQMQEKSQFNQKAIAENKQNLNQLMHLNNSKNNKKV